MREISTYKRIVPGFTLFEALIAMVLSTIVIILSYQSLLNVQKFLLTFGKEAQFVSDFTSLKSRMNIILNKKNPLMANTDGTLCSYNATDTILVNLAPDFIVITEGSRRDTLNPELSSFEIEYVDGVSSAPRIVRKIVLHFEFRNQKFELNISRRGPENQLM